MNIEIDDNLFYDLKDIFMVKFLLDDVETLKEIKELGLHEKDYSKLLRAYKIILKYHGVNNG